MFKEIGDRLAEAKKREVFHEQGEELGKEESRLEEPVRTPCPHCGRKDHEEAMYHFRFESVQGWEKPHQGTRRQKKVRKEAIVGGNSTHNSNAELGANKVSMVCVLRTRQHFILPCGLTA